MTAPKKPTKGTFSVEARARVEELRATLTAANDAYYRAHSMVMSDLEFDRLLRELEDLESAYPALQDPDSPTQRVGSDLDSGEAEETGEAGETGDIEDGQSTEKPGALRGFEKVDHLFPMLSIQNTYSEEEVRDFHRQVTGKVDEAALEYVCEPKIDGVAMSLVYTGRKLVLGVTRGDGVRGDDVTRNILTIQSIPRTLPTDWPEGRVEVRGEVYMAEADFLKYNAYSMRVYGKELQNPRNTTSGSLKLKDPKEAAERPLSFFAYAILEEDQKVEETPNAQPFGDLFAPLFAPLSAQNAGPQDEDAQNAENVENTEKTHWGNLLRLVKAGFPVNSLRERVRGVEEVMAVCARWEEKRAALPYLIDGVVIKVNALTQQAALGRTAKSPKWVIAFKYKTEAAETLLESVDFQVGRTGVVTPVANLKPVALGGTTVRRATLHNFDEIARLGLQVPDTVRVEKGGEIIPKITAVVLEKRTQESRPILPPEACPVCGGELSKVEEEVAWRCDNLQCPAQVQRALLHFASRGAMNIEHMGPALMDALVESGKIADAADLYTLQQEDLEGLERMAEKSAQRVIQSLEESKLRGLDALLFGLGIRFVGKTTARMLARHFGSLDRLQAASLEELETVPEVGGRIAKSLFDYFHNIHNIDLLQELKKAGLKLDYDAPTGEQTLAGQTWVITGTLPSWSREEARTLLENAGAKVSDSVSKKTTALLAGEAAGSKLDKATKLGIPVKSEADVKALLEM